MLGCTMWLCRLQSGIYNYANRQCPQPSTHKQFTMDCRLWSIDQKQLFHLLVIDIVPVVFFCVSGNGDVGALAFVMFLLLAVHTLVPHPLLVADGILHLEVLVPHHNAQQQDDDEYGKYGLQTTVVSSIKTLQW